MDWKSNVAKQSHTITNYLWWNLCFTINPMFKVIERVVVQQFRVGEITPRCLCYSIPALIGLYLFVFFVSQWMLLKFSCKEKDLILFTIGLGVHCCTRYCNNTIIRQRLFNDPEALDPTNSCTYWDCCPRNKLNIFHIIYLNAQK